MDQHTEHTSQLEHNEQEEHESGSVNSIPVESTTEKPRSPWVLFGIGIAAGVIICGGLLFAIFRGDNTSDQNKVAAFFHYIGSSLKGSVASINGDKISYTQYQSDFDTLKKFVEKTPEAGFTFSDEELSDQVLSRLLINRLMKQIAGELDVRPTEDEYQNARQDFLSQFDGEEAAEEELQNRYGWSVEEFMDNVVRPAVLEGKVAQTFSSSTNPDFAKYDAIQEVRARHILFQVEDPAKDETVKKEAESVLKQIHNGADFSEMAAKYGSDGTKETGGDLGFFARGAMVPEFEQAAFSLQPGELGSELVKTQFGYHIIKTEEVKRGLDFQRYLIDRVKSSQIVINDGIHNPFAELINANVADGESVSDTDTSEVITPTEDTNQENS